MSIQMLSPIIPIEPIGGAQKTAPATAAGGVPFASMLSDAMKDAASAQEVASQDALDIIMGTGGDLHNIMINSAMETAAIETAVELTTRVVSAYKEIMQMQV